MSRPGMKRSRVSAGLLMFRRPHGRIEVFLVHPGGPLWAKKDEGAWSIPKGEVEGEADLLQTALREFKEETGITPRGEFLPLGSVRQKGGKTVHAWAFEGDIEEGQTIRSNTFRMEWPPRSGRLQEFPEIDRAEFFELKTARKKIHPAQAEWLDRLVESLQAP